MTTATLIARVWRATLAGDSKSGHRARASLSALGSLVVAIALVGIRTAPATAAGLETNFDTGLEGWTCLGCSSLDYHALGGNPNGYATFNDSDSGSSESLGLFAGPTTWAGNRSSLYNGTMSFDLRLSAPDDSGRTALVVLGDSSTGDAAVAYTGQEPTVEWATFTVSLTEATGWRSLAALNLCPPTDQSCIDAIPTLTKLQFQSVLANFDGVGILADYQIGPGEQTDLDTVALKPPSVASRTLTIGYAKAQHAFKGRLTSGDAGCAAHQSVSVYRVRTGPDVLIGTAKTKGAGAWTLSKPARPGSYYAVAPRSNLQPGMSCGNVTSSRLAVH